MGWVILTTGRRPAELAAAIDSLASGDVDPQVVVVANGAPAGTAGNEMADNLSVVHLAENVGVPAGRDRGLAELETPIVGFLDDDAVMRGSTSAILDAFERDPQLGAVALRLVDEDGETARRHVPRLGGKDPGRSGDVAFFLGGACAVRREAYDAVGGYFGELFYGHEEVELSWRLVDAGWKITYLADVEVFHPRTTIERHADGWELTGRNRVLVARRTLPWPVAGLHVGLWLILGARRAPRGECRQRYVQGWRSGWRMPVRRRPISWRGVARLTALRRPPIV